MRKQTIEYSSPLDALIAIIQRLGCLKEQLRLDSDEFFHHYCQGKLADDAEFVEWANDYRQYLQLRQELDGKLKEVSCA